MLNAILFGFRLIVLVLGGHRQVALENVALRQQLTAFTRDIKRPRLRRWDRLFWMGLATIWKDWRSALVIVRPETVIGWQRRRFKQYWRRLSQSNGPGRPGVSVEIRKLVKSMAAANHLWGAPRIHGELLKLGFEISERTVSRLIPRRDKKPSQTWRTFLRNHVRAARFRRFLHGPYNSITSTLCLRGSRPRPPSSPALQCHRTPHRSVDGAANR